MNFDIVLLAQPKNRPYLVRRVNGTYEQHSHMQSKQDCEEIIKLMKANKLPNFKDKELNKEYKVAIERLLTTKEFKRLQKKENYRNINKGGKKK